ncbi:flavin monoamine oxidase family protein [Arenibaculum pallidiluteum]|uniref:flavin monoamine oxidase family protein n=1 Tax=Arenibaculum pallidiluteum TaxID=2812559 RepID=UPI001A9643EC|nr:NAD(P)/FAD-dependent oxidoreductase [Arenibaculum pallidiluteum]
MISVEVAVVGAGAAGLAAARTLRKLGIATVVIEARGRPGGRAHTVEIGQLPADLGCEWLHDARRNAWAAAARELGFAIDAKEPEWGERMGRHQLSPADRAEMGRAFDAFWDAVAAAGRGPDAPVAAVLPPDGARWRPAFDAITGFINGAGIDVVSAVDIARYQAEGPNRRVMAGYGTLIARHADGLDVVYSAPVTTIDLSGRRCLVETPRGRLEAGAVVLTVPIGVLKAGSIRIVPGLPPAILSALDGLDMGHVAKLFLEVEGRPWDLAPDTTLLGSFERARTGSYIVEPLGRPLVEAYFGGELARDLEASGRPALAAFALDELAGIFGSSVRTALRPAAASSWVADPCSLGAYSFARPGGADGRATLSAPVLDRLFIAGEALPADAYGTAHGAHDSGVAAAQAAASAIRA